VRFKHRKLDDSFEWHTRAEAIRTNLDAHPLGHYYFRHWPYEFDWTRYYLDHPEELELHHPTIDDDDHIDFYTSPPSSPITFASPSPTPTEQTPEPAFVYLDYDSPLIRFHFADVPEVRYLIGQIRSLLRFRITETRWFTLHVLAEELRYLIDDAPDVPPRLIIRINPGL
jgi:hypothetical protein